MHSHVMERNYPTVVGGRLWTPVTAVLCLFAHSSSSIISTDCPYAPTISFSGLGKGYPPHALPRDRRGLQDLLSPSHQPTMHLVDVIMHGKKPALPLRLDHKLEPLGRVQRSIHPAAHEEMPRILPVFINRQPVTMCHPPVRSSGSASGSGPIHVYAGSRFFNPSPLSE